MHQKIKFTPMKIHKTVATRAVPFGPDMHQIVCRLGLRPRPHGGAYSAPPDPLAGLRGPTSKGGEGRGGKGSGGEGSEGEESAPLDLNPGDATALLVAVDFLLQLEGTVYLPISVREYVFYVFFSNFKKNMTFYVFLK